MAITHLNCLLTQKVISSLSIFHRQHWELRLWSETLSSLQQVSIWVNSNSGFVSFDIRIFNISSPNLALDPFKLEFSILLVQIPFRIIVPFHWDFQFKVPIPGFMAFHIGIFNSNCTSNGPGFLSL